jgi:DNA-directed RNA polymerase subunit M/transcription elongation factor TFIIS
MHTRPVNDSSGEFIETNNPPLKCPKCNQFSVYCKTWKSSCGGYEDTKHTCKKCGYYWWIDGIDA